jgi:hypothetical protein
LQKGIEHSRTQVKAMAASADVAAKRVIADRRHLYIAGSQPDFAPEMLERAGGLMCVQSVPRQINRGDVILYAARSTLDASDQVKISTWRRDGGYVIAFASAARSTNPYFKPDTLIDSGDDEGIALANGKLCPVDSVLNIANGWAWTGEFVAACTRLNRMPVLYESYGLPGGRERDERYRGKWFHDDLQITPISAGTLANAYLDNISKCLAGIRRDGIEPIREAGRWVREAGVAQCQLQAVAHIFPQHFQDARSPKGFSSMLSAAMTPPTIDPRDESPQVIVLLGYQEPVQLLVDWAHLYRHKLFYTSVTRAIDDRGENVRYVDPHWPVDDGCVSVKGYDIPILPASAIAQAAIYWSIVAEAQPTAQFSSRAEATNGSP